MNFKHKFFNELIKRVDYLNNNPTRDNEATRHDQLIYPIITNELGLGWNPIDIISQHSINVPNQIAKSHLFRDAVPKIRKPDLLIYPPELRKNIAIIEEKKKQKNIKELNKHRLQAHEYQGLYECTWGILTDGEHWIVKRNFETYHEFSSLYELIDGIEDLKATLGRTAVIERINNFSTSDIILIIPSQKILQSPLSLQSNIESFGFENNIPIVVCGVDNREVTTNGMGYEEFANLEMALNAFPDLHPRMTTERFTWAMKEIKDNKIIKLRFETWAANKFYSS